MHSLSLSLSGSSNLQSYLFLDGFRILSPKAWSNRLKPLPFSADSEAPRESSYRGRVFQKWISLPYRTIFFIIVTTYQQLLVIAVRFCRLSRVIRVCPLLLSTTLSICMAKPTGILQTCLWRKRQRTLPSWRQSFSELEKTCRPADGADYSYIVHVGSFFFPPVSAFVANNIFFSDPLWHDAESSNCSYGTIIL